jgi:hypothetical protein
MLQTSPNFNLYKRDPIEPVPMAEFLKEFMVDKLEIEMKQAAMSQHNPCVDQPHSLQGLPRRGRSDEDDVKRADIEAANTGSKGDVYHTDDWGDWSSSWGEDTKQKLEDHLLSDEFTKYVESQTMGLGPQQADSKRKECIHRVRRGWATWICRQVESYHSRNATKRAVDIAAASKNITDRRQQVAKNTDDAVALAESVYMINSKIDALSQKRLQLRREGKVIVKKLAVVAAEQSI